MTGNDWKADRVKWSNAYAASEERAARLEKERDEAQRAKYGTPCRCESWIAACRAAEERAAQAERLVRTATEVIRFYSAGGHTDGSLAKAWLEQTTALQEAAKGRAPEAPPTCPDCGRPMELSCNSEPCIHKAFVALGAQGEEK